MEIRPGLCWYHPQARSFFPLEGMSVYDTVEHFCKLFNIPASRADEILNKKIEHYLKHHSFVFFPFVEEFIDSLRLKNISFALVTAGMRNRLNATVPLDFLAKFPVIITGERGVRMKPCPDPYLAAAQELGVDPRESIVVENAPLGVQAAKAAGCFCIALETSVSKEYLTQADETYPSFLDMQKSLAIQNLTISTICLQKNSYHGRRRVHRSKPLRLFCIT